MAARENCCFFMKVADSLICNIIFLSKFVLWEIMIMCKQNVILVCRSLSCKIRWSRQEILSWREIFECLINKNVRNSRTYSNLGCKSLFFLALVFRKFKKKSGCEDGFQIIFGCKQKHVTTTIKRGAQCVRTMHKCIKKYKIKQPCSNVKLTCRDNIAIYWRWHFAWSRKHA